MKGYNVRLALESAKLSQLAYEKFEKDPLSFSLDLRAKGYALEKVVHNPETETQAFIASKDDKVFVVFRGTYEIPADVFTDIAAQIIDGGHEGIFKAFRSVQDELDVFLKNNIGNRKAYAAGHSLGGGLAKAAVLEMKHIPWEACYTFGAPAICNEAKAGGLKTPVYSVVNVGDIVPRVMEIPNLKDVSLLLSNALKELVASGNLRLSGDVDYAEYMQKIGQSLEQYRHFPELIYYNRQGRRVVAGDSLEIFNAAIKENWRAAYEDHAISSYCNHLQAYIDLSEALRPIEV